MPYDRLGERLRDAGSPTLTTLPDGSVDRYCTLAAGAVGPLATLQSFGRELVERNRSTFRVDVETTEAGGQAVNAAGQLHALGGDVTCYGHLEGAVFDDLPFEAVSMGQPAIVDAFNFRDGDVMLVEETGTDEWTLDDLRAVADLREALAVDAVCCANWISFPGLGPAFHELGDEELPRIPFVLDPGDLVGSGPEEIHRLRAALAALQDTFDVVYNANPREIRATAADLPDAPEDDAERVAAIRETTGVHAVVSHGQAEAIAATAQGTTTVENRRVEEPTRHTGGGDHFSGGLGFALAEGWEWDVALACGNACAGYYVETGETGGREDVREFAREDRPSAS